MKRLHHLLAMSIVALSFSGSGASALAQGAPPGGGKKAPAGTGGKATWGTKTKKPAPAASASASSAAAPAPGASAPAPAAEQPAQAQPQPAPASGSAGSGTEIRADDFFRRANDLTRANKWSEAEPLYRAAFELRQSYDIAGNLGVAEFRQNKYRDAAEHLAFALKSFPVTGKPAARDTLEQTFNKAKAEVGTVTIQVNVNGAQIAIDGRPVGTSPLAGSVFVEPGSREIEASLAGHEPSRQKVEVAKGSTQEVSLKLEVKKEKVALEKPRLVVRPKPWAPGLEWYIAGGAAAVVGLGVGVGFTIAANGASADAEEIRGQVGGQSACANQAATGSGQCAALYGSVENQGTFSSAAVAGFVVGGVFALGTAGLFAWTMLQPEASLTMTDSKRDSVKLRVLPAVGADSRGVVLMGSW